MDILLKDIINFLGSDILEIHGDVGDKFIRYLKPSDLADEYTLDWINSNKEKKQEIASNSKAKVLITNNSVSFTNKMNEEGKVLIFVSNPKLAIALVGQKFLVNKQISGNHGTAVIDPSAHISKNSFIAANTTLGKCKIGENSIIYPNVTIYDGVIIGNNVIIQAGTVIGMDGLGCERQSDYSLVKFPHFGGVVISDNVEIGANCQIARGALSDTIIGNGCKINAGTTVAHNCIIEDNVWISFNSTIAGSSKVSRNVNIFSNVVIREQLLIGEKATVGMGAVVTKNIPAGETWVGNPARKLK